jgi:SAM-dependent methyltransferase
MNNPAYYYLHHQNVIDDLPFWKRLLKEMGSPVLELGCGTGRVLLPLIQAGHEVVGLDISYQALSYLRSQVSKTLENELKIFQADIECFRLGRQFSLVFMACNTLSTFQRSMRQKVYARIRDHLSGDGIFAASIPNPWYLASLIEEGESEVETSFAHPVTANPIQVSSGWRRIDQSIVIHWHYDHLLPDGQVERETIEITHSLTSMDEYQAELRSADLHLIKVFGDFDRSDYGEDSPYLILIAGKRPGF